MKKVLFLSVLLAVFCCNTIAQVQVAIIGTTSFCTGQQDCITATATNGTPPYNYLWSTTDTSATICVTSGGLYEVTVTDNLGDTASTSAVITELPPPMVTIIPPNADICLGDCVALSGSGGFTYYWTPSTGLSSPGLSNPMACPAVTTTYTLITSDMNGCTGFGSVTVNVIPGLQITADNQLLCGSDTAILTASGGTSYLWDTGDTTQSISVWPSVSSVYFVTATGVQGGCNNINSITITVSASPAMPGNIFGNFWPCPGNIEIYSIASLPGIIYVWTVPVGWIIMAGQGTNSIAVNVGNASGNIEVFPSNNCGLGPARSAAVIPNCGANLMAKAGMVYRDLNQNGSRDVGEPPLSGMIVQQDTVPYYFMTNDSGVYQAYYDNGTYNLSLPNYNSYCTISPAFHTLTGVTDSTNDFGIYCNGALDMGVYLIGTAIIPGYYSNLILVCNNLGNTIADGNISLKYDSELVFNNTDTPFSYHANDSIVWNYSNLLPGQSVVIYNVFDMPITSVLGDTILFSAWVLPIIGDSIPANNSCSNSPVVVGPFDPNDKQVSETVITPEQVVNEPDLIYTIRFQNTGTATAVNVVIKDSLTSKLIIPSLETLGSSHPCVFSLEPDGTAIWTFNNIMLPDSGADYEGSQGFVMFKIKAKGNLVLGDSINNAAGIHFDLNVPVITNFATTVIKDLMIGVQEITENSSVLHIFPNPANDKLNIVFLGSETHSFELNIFSMSNQIIYSENTECFNGSYSKTFDLKFFSEGIYFVQIISEDEVMLKKVVVIR